MQVLKQLKNKSEIRVLDDVVKIAPQLLSQIMSMTKVDIPENSHVSARAILKLGVGITGGICLGWADTKGFHMVGCRGAISAAASIGGDIMAGLHHTRQYVKAILGISNVCVEMVFELPEKAQTGTAGTPDEQASAAKIEDVVGQGEKQRDELGVQQPVSTAEDAQPPGKDAPAGAGSAGGEASAVQAQPNAGASQAAGSAAAASEGTEAKKSELGADGTVGDASIAGL